MRSSASFPSAATHPTRAPTASQQRNQGKTHSPYAGAVKPSDTAYLNPVLIVSLLRSTDDHLKESRPPKSRLESAQNIPPIPKKRFGNPRANRSAWVHWPFPRPRNTTSPRLDRRPSLLNPRSNRLSRPSLRDHNSTLSRSTYASGLANA